MHTTLAMADRARAAQRMTAHVPSPCISVCRMDAQGILCQGCLRTLQEIRDWPTLGDPDKRAVWARIEQRAVVPPGV